MTGSIVNSLLNHSFAKILSFAIKYVCEESHNSTEDSTVYVNVFIGNLANQALFDLCKVLYSDLMFLKTPMINERFRYIPRPGLFVRKI